LQEDKNLSLKSDGGDLSCCNQADLEMAMRIAKVLDFININQITDAWLLSVAQMVRNRRGRSYDPIGENSHISLIY